jgi:hypothetical protein
LATVDTKEQVGFEVCQGSCHILFLGRIDDGDRIDRPSNTVRYVPEPTDRSPVDLDSRVGRINDRPKTMACCGQTLDSQIVETIENLDATVASAKPFSRYAVCAVFKPFLPPGRVSLPLSHRTETRPLEKGLAETTFDTL